MGGEVAKNQAPSVWRRRFLTGLRVVLAGFFGAVVVGLLALVGAAWAYRHSVVQNPGAHLEKQNIRAVIAQESPVFYRDGVTRVGVFFTAEHRQYVPFEDLPEPYVMALVAAEDGAYWGHRGVNLRGITRAMRDNLRAGRVVAGGSTLTQQTAKNLYYRPDRSLKAKGTELLNALRLESHYDKREILTFYVNQFHVTGNGRGIGIAARHFFDKEVEDLTVLECAFLAGLVKAPSHYDPFLGDEARRQRSLERSGHRTRYVLQRMLDEPLQNLIGFDDSASGEQRARDIRDEVRTLLDEGSVPEFKRGTFRYDSSAVLDEVARRLAEPPFDAVLDAAGVDEPATAGLQVVTTLDKDAQRAAIYGLWHHLTEVGIWLEKLEAKDLKLTGAKAPRFDPDYPPVPKDFRLGIVDAVLEPEGRSHLSLDLGGHPCVVDRDAIIRIAVAVTRGARGDRSSKAPTAAVDDVVAQLPVGSVVRVSVREGPYDGPATCDLELTPELQGSMMVLQDGQVRAMVGGNDNRNFNRATALRQMGSTWKPLVFHAAMRLGWAPDDELDNRRNVFPYSTTYYYPRPDHKPSETVSMAWAGVNSENLASIWLLYHLTDRLNGDEIRELASSLGLAREEGEDEKAYRYRIQVAGVLPTRSRVAEALFLQARSEVLAGIEGSTHPEDKMPLASLLYGWGYGAERKRVAREGSSTRVFKEVALDYSWSHLSRTMASCTLQHSALQQAVEMDSVPESDAVPDLSVLIDEDTVRVACGTLPEGFAAPDESFMETLRGLVEAAVPEEEEVEEGRPRRGWRRFWAEDEEEVDPPSPLGPQVAGLDDMELEGRIHFSTLSDVRDALERRQLALELHPEPPDLYDPELLYWHQDFRVLLSLRYLSSLAEEYGVQSEIQTVLAMPLGASEITLEEAASVYSGVISGHTWSFPGRAGTQEVDSPPAPALLISEVRDVDGRILYIAEPEPSPIAQSAVGEMSADILRNVVRWGTGRRALNAVRLGSVTVPLGGKTGTTNEFRNAAFLGFAPVYEDGVFSAVNGYVVGAYVGYDDNRPMVQGRIRIAGSSGALPAWIVTIRGMAQAGLLGEVAPTGDAERVSLIESSGMVRVPVTEGVGLVSEDLLFDPDKPSILLPQSAVVSEVDFDPLVRPARIAPTTAERPDPEARGGNLWGSERTRR
jgi:penicillin-binding protein 1A